MDVAWQKDTISATTDSTCGDYSILTDFNSVLSSIDFDGEINPSLTTII